MKNILLAPLMLMLAWGVSAQEPQKEEGYRFTDVKTLPATSVKDQNRSGTCWAYSALAFLESEILREGGKPVDLSEMWIVRNAYFEKAVKYARLHGSLNLAVGGGSRDVTDGIAKYGIVPKIHANEMAVSGGVQVGVRNNALSVDHLERMGAEEIKVLAGSRTMPTMLPGAAFFLELPFPPARQMIEAGLGVALASDFNPGSSPSGNMKFVLSLACIKMRMTPAEAINAATLNSAYAMGLSKEYGSITVGKKANFFLTSRIPSIEYIPYAYTSPLVRRVFLQGREVKC